MSDYRTRHDQIQPWSPMEVEQSIIGTIEEMEAITCDLLSLATRAAEVRRAYEDANARAWLSVVGEKANETVKRAIVHTMLVPFEGDEISVGDLKYRSELADAVVNTTRAKMRLLEHQADLLRTLMASNRAVT